MFKSDLAQLNSVMPGTNGMSMNKLASASPSSNSSMSAVGGGDSAMQAKIAPVIIAAGIAAGASVAGGAMSAAGSASAGKAAGAQSKEQTKLEERESVYDNIWRLSEYFKAKNQEMRANLMSLRRDIQ